MKTRGDNSILFDEDCLKLIDIKKKTYDKVVLVVAPFFNFTKEENKVLKPLREAHKRQGTYWEKAYQAVKHDRYASLSKGNVKAFIHALAALYLLNVYYKNMAWTSKYQEINNIDYSLGSTLFTVKPPTIGLLWEDNIPIISQSPYVVKYNDADYKKIEDIRNKELQESKEYLTKQPEFQDTSFIRQLSDVVERKGRDNVNLAMIFLELAKYRINKKIPKNHPFDEKKRILINSVEWNCQIHQNNKHITADELTNENIQEEIDNVGIHWGMEILSQHQKPEWISRASDSGICEVYIP